MQFNKRTIGTLMLAVMLAAVTMAFPAAGLASMDRPGEGVTVKAGLATWTSGFPKSAVTQVLLEELGYTVEGPTTFPSNPIAYLAISEGDIDYWPNGWFPIHSPQLPAGFEDRGSLVGMICEGCGLEGYLASIPAIEEFGITTLGDLKRPEVKAAFDATGDGKAELYGCPPGWGCHETIEFHMDAYDLRDHVNHVTADYTAGFADAMARVQAGEPTVFYTWTPNYTVLNLVPGEDVLWIGVPELQLAPAHEGFDVEILRAEGLEGAVSDPIDMGFVPNDILYVANNNFLEANPAAATLLENIRLPLGWISEADARIADGEDSDAEIIAMAQEWVEANRGQVDEWLAAARQAAN